MLNGQSTLDGLCELVWGSLPRELRESYSAAEFELDVALVYKKQQGGSWDEVEQEVPSSQALGRTLQYLLSLRGSLQRDPLPKVVFTPRFKKAPAVGKPQVTGRLVLHKNVAANLEAANKLYRLGWRQGLQQQQQQQQQGCGVQDHVGLGMPAAQGGTAVTQQQRQQQDQQQQPLKKRRADAEPSMGKKSKLRVYYFWGYSHLREKS